MHPVSGIPFKGWDDMAVDTQGRGDMSVSQHLLHHSRRNALDQQEGSAAVTEMWKRCLRRPALEEARKFAFGPDESEAARAAY